VKLTYKTWKDEYVVHEDTHRGYDFVIKLLPEDDDNFKCYYCYVKVPNNHKFYGIDYQNMDIKAHGGLSFSEKIENDWWVGWDYGYEFRDYELKDIFMDCCYVIMQLIEEDGGRINNDIKDRRSTLSKEISEHAANSNKENRIV
jgi:hypothetical protein